MSIDFYARSQVMKIEERGPSDLNDQKKGFVDLVRCLFVCKRGDTTQYHGGLRFRELDQAPMLLVFLTPRQALSSHPCQQMI